MNRRGLLALLMMPFGQQTWGEGSISFSNNWKVTNWKVTLPEKLTIVTKDGWERSFTHDELKRILTEDQ